ncbi:asparagine synthetase B family protein [Bowmanella yangjiangensis]|uniref:asparagine synthetase B family protein n=1 Tax=Bowmanella yangjiangensis TaxID=2811230 RepID=UPI001E500F42|nr:asparagine synthase-related protein [Bowmanella yangjiangensis]
MWSFELKQKNVGESGQSYHWTDGLNSTLSFTSHRDMHVWQSEKLHIGVLGRIRPYGQPYPNQSDLEWLENLWLEEPDPAAFYPKISGFFILLLGCRRSGQMTMVNDHVGALPLYWRHQAGTTLAGTRLAYVTGDDASVSPQSVYNYFYYHCIPGPYTLYANVQKLLPGSGISLSEQSVKPLALYIPRYDVDTDIQALQRECFNLVEKAVAWNAGPECGAFLSGGLDSSTVAGMLAKQQTPAKTFSIGFHAKGYDETPYAEITAKHFTTEHLTHYLEPGEITEHFIEVAAAFDQPFGNSSALAAYICAKFAKQHGVSVLLAGDGGDELFGGNERYAKQKIFEVYHNLPGWLRGTADALFYDSPLGQLPVGKKVRSYIQQARVPMPHRLHTYNFLKRMDPASMFTDNVWQAVDPNVPGEMYQQRYDACPAADMLERMLYLDWKFTLADNDLVKVTQMCELAGVEVRFPLIEKELVDFSCRVPSSEKLPGNKLRYFYKNSFKGFLADETLNKSKHGFGLPFGVWMKQEPALQALTNELLTSFKTRGIMQPEFVDQAMHIYQQGHQGYYGELIWIMLVFEAWMQRQ